MRLSVVIATKDRAPYLERSLATLAVQQEAPPFEAVVVDNGSSDATGAVLADAATRYASLALRVVALPEPNRAAARNAGVAAANGDIVVFVDDDVLLPAHFLASHGAQHRAGRAGAVSGPILNVPGYDARPKPTLANYSGAFFCTCNVSLSRAALLAAGGFDERFVLYGWEDTELGLRLRAHGVRRRFAWDAYLWHIKPPRAETFEVQYDKTVERALMAARFVRKHPTLRTKLATGAYGPNLLRSKLLAPRWSFGAYRALATSARVPKPLRLVARAQLLDGTYTSTLRGALGRETS